MSACEEGAESLRGAFEAPHPDHQQLLNFWHANRWEGFVPLRASFDPAAHPQLLPRLAIIARETAKEGPVYRYRLAGSEIVARAGRDPTGKSFEDLYDGEYLANAVALYDTIAAKQEPHMSRQTYQVTKDGGVLCYDRLVLPMTSAGTDVDRFILLVVVVSQSSKSNIVGSFLTFGSDASNT